MLAWRNVQYAAGIGAEFLLRMLQRQAWLVVGYDNSLPVGVVVALSTTAPRHRAPQQLLAAITKRGRQQVDGVTAEPVEIQVVIHRPRRGIVEDKTLDRLSGQAIFPRVARALDIVRAAGGDVEAEGIELVERVEAGEIDTEEAVRLIIAKYDGG